MRNLIVCATFFSVLPVFHSSHVIVCIELAASGVKAPRILPLDHTGFLDYVSRDCSAFLDENE